MHGKRRGVVVEIADGYAIVLTPDGQFCRVPVAQGVELGVELSFESVTSPASSQPGLRHVARVRRYTSVAVAACLAVAVGVWAGLANTSHSSGPTGTPYALVSLDINPSVTLGVDRQMRVQTTTANDKDGNTILSQLPTLAGESLQQAVARIVAQAVIDKLVPQSDSIYIAAAPVQSAANSRMSSLVNATRQTVLQTLNKSGASHKLHPVVFSLSVPESVFSAARKADLPPGQVASYLYAQGKGVSAAKLTPAAVRNILGAEDNVILSVNATQSADQVTKLIEQLVTSGVIGKAPIANKVGSKFKDKGLVSSRGQENESSNAPSPHPSGGGGPLKLKGKHKGTGPVHLHDNHVSGSGSTKTDNTAENTVANTVANTVSNALGEIGGTLDGEANTLLGDLRNGTDGHSDH